MDCRDFRKKHLAFVDDTLPGVELVAMQRHLLECESCARHDTLIRRGLMLFRSLPSIEPSADFSDRLYARIAAEQRAGVQLPPPPRYRGPDLKTFVAAALGVVAVGYLSAAALDRVAPEEPTLAPVVATLPEPLPPVAASPALAASVSTGLAVWPALLLAEQAPLHLMTVQFQR